jgi:hypothetical protein
VGITCRTPITSWLTIQGDPQREFVPGTKALLAEAPVTAPRHELSLP